MKRIRITIDAFVPDFKVAPRRFEIWQREIIAGVEDDDSDLVGKILTEEMCLTDPNVHIVEVK